MRLQFLIRNERLLSWFRRLVSTRVLSTETNVFTPVAVFSKNKKPKTPFVRRKAVVHLNERQYARKE